MHLVIEDTAMDEIGMIYPQFIIDEEFAIARHRRILEYEESREEMYQCNEYDNYSYDPYYEEPTYERYNGSYAQDVEGYSDDEIDTIFDGDPDAYWNID